MNGGGGVMFTQFVLGVNGGLRGLTPISQFWMILHKSFYEILVGSDIKPDFKI